MKLRVTLFGPMLASGAQGQDVLPSSRKARAVLAILAMNAPRPVLRGELTELLWSQRGREQARASLRQAVHMLGEALGALGGGAGAGLLRVDRTHLALNGDGVWVDALALERIGPMRVGAAAMDGIPGRRDKLARTLALFRPGLLDDLVGLDPAFDRWRVTQLARLRAIARARAEEILAASADPARQEPRAVIAAAEQLLGIDPAHEGAWRAMIRIHAARGDRAAAVRAFELCAEALAQSARLAPSEETAALLLSIRDPVVSGVAPPADSRAAGSRLAKGGGEQAGRENRQELRIGVLPLRKLGPEQGGQLSLGLAEEITYALSRLSWISCVAPIALAALARERGADAAQDVPITVWELLDLDFLLEGTVQRAGGRVRVMVRLLDLRAQGEVIWARRYDREETDILTLQDTIAAETVAQLDPELLVREGERARRPGAGGRRTSRTRMRGDATAYDLLLRAIPAIYRLEHDGFHAAGEMLDAALALDPTNASAHAWYAYWHLFLVGQGWAGDPLAMIQRSGELAERAVLLDPNDARALTMAGHVRGFLRRRPAEGLELHERALAVNPNLALAWCFAGLSLCYLGRHEEAIARVEQAQRLSPFDPHGFFFDMAAGMPLLLLHRHEQAVEIGRRALALNPGFSSTYKGHLAALGHLGLGAEAAEIRARLLALEPDFSVRTAVARSPFTRAQDIAHYADGLRQAGLAE